MSRRSNAPVASGTAQIQAVAARYAANHVNTAPDAVHVIACAARYDWPDVPPPTPAELTAALTLVARARYEASRDADMDELDLIGAALTAGLSWQQVGEQLGYVTHNAARAAKTRHAALVGRWPCWSLAEYRFTVNTSEVTR